MLSSQLLFSFYGFLPELLLVATVLVGAIIVRHGSLSVRLPVVLTAGYAIAGLLVLLIQLPLTDNSFKAEWLFQGPNQPLGSGMIVIDWIVVIMKLALLLPLLGAALSQWLTGNVRPSASSIFQCSGLLGLWIIVGADDLLTLFAGLELVGLSTWKMLQQQGGSTRRTMILSAVATPAMLLGIGLIASFTNATNYATINNFTTAQNSAPIPVLLFVAGSLLLLVGIAIRGGLFPSFASVSNLPGFASFSARIFILLLAPVGVLVGIMRLLGRAWPSQLPELHWQPIVGGLTVMVMLLAVVAMLREEQPHLILAHLVTVSIAFLFLPILPFDGDGSPYILEMLFGVMTATLAIMILLSRDDNSAVNFTLSKFQGVGRTGRIEGHLVIVGIMLLAGLPWGILFITRLFLLLGLAEGGYLWIAWMGAIAVLGMWITGGKIVVIVYRRIPLSDIQPNQDFPPILSTERWRVAVAVVLLLANILSAVPPISDYVWFRLLAWHDAFAGGWR